jgi:hypothetical protein
VGPVWEEAKGRRQSENCGQSGENRWVEKRLERRRMAGSARTPIFAVQAS